METDFTEDSTQSYSDIIQEIVQNSINGLSTFWQDTKLYARTSLSSASTRATNFVGTIKEKFNWSKLDKDKYQPQLDSSNFTPETYKASYGNAGFALTSSIIGGIIINSAIDNELSNISPIFETEIHPVAMIIGAIAFLFSGYSAGKSLKNREISNQYHKDAKTNDNDLPNFKEQIGQDKYKDAGFAILAFALGSFCIYSSITSPDFLYAAITLSMASMAVNSYYLGKLSAVNTAENELTNIISNPNSNKIIEGKVEI